MMRSQDTHPRWDRLRSALLDAVEALPGPKRERGQRGLPGHVIEFCAPDREDRRPSAYLKAWGDPGGDGLPVWGDGGLPRAGTALELAHLLGVDVVACGFSARRPPYRPLRPSIRR